MDTKGYVRSLWSYCILIAFVEFVVSGGVVTASLSKGTPVSSVLLVTTLIFQLLAFPFIIGFTIPSVVTIIKKADMTLEIGKKSSESLAQLQSEFVPVLKSLKTGISDLSELVEKVKHGNGELKDTIRKAVGEARVLIKDGESEVEKFIFNKIDQFLSGALAQKEDENGQS